MEHSLRGQCGTASAQPHQMMRRQPCREFLLSFLSLSSVSTALPVDPDHTGLPLDRTEWPRIHGTVQLLLAGVFCFPWIPLVCLDRHSDPLLFSIIFFRRRDYYFEDVHGQPVPTAKVVKIGLDHPGWDVSYTIPMEFHFSYS